MTYQLIQGDCIDSMKQLEAGSVQTCVTSPPYYGLRDYGAVGQIGIEDTPDAYVAKLVDVFREVKRVLRDDGTLWLNLGDSYANTGLTDPSKVGGFTGDRIRKGVKGIMDSRPRKIPEGIKPKDLIGIPWLVAFALRADGWYLRSDIIWHKPNPMPESVTDRPTKSHEYIFLLSKSREYFYDADAVREPLAESTLADSRNTTGRHTQGKESSKYFTEQSPEQTLPDKPSWYRSKTFVNPAIGRNRRTVWSVPTYSFEGAHFATFPPDLIEPCILVGTSAHGCCAKCGAVWERVTEVEREATRPGNPIKADNSRNDGGRAERMMVVSSVTAGWQPTCTCNADVVPCTVLDPFNGSGTTGAVALKHGRKYIGCELNPDYIELAHRRITQMQPMLLGVTA